MKNGKEGEIKVSKSHKKFHMVNHVEKPEIRTLFYNQDLPTVIILAPVMKLE